MALILVAFFFILILHSGMMIVGPSNTIRGQSTISEKEFLIEGYSSAAKEFNTEFLHDWPTPLPGGPYFDTSVSINVTGLVGKTVYLVCKVKNLGNRTVSWVS